MDSTRCRRWKGEVRENGMNELDPSKTSDAGAYKPRTRIVNGYYTILCIYPDNYYECCTDAVWNNNNLVNGGAKRASNIG